MKKTLFLLIILLSIFTGSIDLEFDKKSYAVGEPINVKVSVDMPEYMKKGVLNLVILRNGDTFPLKKYIVDQKHMEFYYSTDQEPRLKQIPPGRYSVLAILTDEKGTILDRKTVRFAINPEKKKQFPKILIILGILGILLIFGGFFLGRSYYRKPKGEPLSIEQVEKSPEVLQETFRPVHSLLSELETGETKFLDINQELKNTDQKILELDEKYQSGEISESAYENVSFELRKKKVDLEEGKNRIYNVFENAKKELNKLEVDLETLETNFSMGNIDKEKYKEDKEELESLIADFKTHI